MKKYKLTSLSKYLIALIMLLLTTAVLTSLSGINYLFTIGSYTFVIIVLMNTVLKGE